jgi:hypothetical protein
MAYGLWPVACGLPMSMGRAVTGLDGGRTTKSAWLLGLHPQPSNPTPPPPLLLMVPAVHRTLAVDFVVDHQIQ